MNTWRDALLVAAGSSAATLGVPDSPGVTAGTADNYFLRSTIPVVPPDPVIVVPLPIPVPGDPPLPPNPGTTPIPIYRPEVPIYAALFPAAQQIVQGMLGTFHQRMGDQSQQQQTGAFPAGWGRVYGTSSRQDEIGQLMGVLATKAARDLALDLSVKQ